MHLGLSLSITRPTLGGILDALISFASGVPAPTQIIYYDGDEITDLAAFSPYLDATSYEHADGGTVSAPELRVDGVAVSAGDLPFTLSEGQEVTIRVAGEDSAPLILDISTVAPAPAVDLDLGNDDGIARVGSTITVAILNAQHPVTAYRIGTTPGGTEISSGTNLPADITVPQSADTGDPQAPATLYVEVDVNGVTRSAQAVIRAELPVYTTPVSITEGAAGSYTLDPGAATGATPINHILTFNGADVLSEVVSGMWLHNDRGTGVLAYQSIATSSGGVVLSNNAVLTIETQSPGWVINDQNVIESIGLPSQFAIAVDDEKIITLEIDNG